MLGRKSLLSYFLFMAVLFGSACANTTQSMEHSDIPESGGTSAINYDLFIRSPSEPMLLSSQDADGNEDLNIKNNNLTTYFEAITRVPMSETCKQVSGGIATAFSILPSAQVLVPLAIMGLDELGVTPSVIPQTLLYPVLMGTPLVILGGIAGYRAIQHFPSSTPDDVVAAQKIATDCEPSPLESWAYSRTTQAFETVFWWGLTFGLIMNIESRLDSADGWGNPLIWGCVFGALALPLVYAIFTHPSNNPNKNVFRRFSKSHKAVLDVTDDMTDSIGEGRLTHKIRAVGRELNIMSFSIQAPSNDESFINNNEGDQEKKLQAEPNHILAFKEIITATEKLPPDIKNWREWGKTFSTGASSVIHASSFPMDVMLTYGLLSKLSAICRASAAISMGISIPITVIAAPFLALSSLKEQVLTKKEIFQLLNWYKPQKASGYWGERLAPILTRLTTYVYIVNPAISYLSEEILLKTIGIHNAPLRIALLTPLILRLWATASQAVEGSYCEIPNWFAKGGKVNLACCNKSYKLLGFLDPENNTTNALEMLDRIGEIRDKVLGLNQEHEAFLYSQLPIKKKEADPLI